MSMKILSQEEFEKGKEITVEYPDGSEQVLPARTKEIFEKIIAVENERFKITEYEYYKQMFTILLGEKGFSKIAPKAENTNLDYLAKVWDDISSKFFAEKNKSLNNSEELKKLDPLFKKMNDLNSLINTLEKTKKLN